MKWASKFKLFAMGLAVATACQSISASPVLRSGGPDSGLNTTCLMPAWQGGESIAPFQAAPPTLIDDAKVLETRAAQDAIATLIGLPLLQLDGFEAINPIEVKPAADIDALVASILGNDGVDVDAALAELAQADGADALEDATNLLGSQGAGGGGGGGAFYGGANVHMGGAPLIASGHASHKSTQGGGGGSVTPSVVVPTIISTDGTAISGGGGSTVPLPASAWSGLALLATLGGALKLRSNREQVA